MLAFGCSEQYEQNEQYEQSEHIEQFEHLEQFEQYEQYEHVEQFEQFEQSVQSIQLFSASLALPSDPKYSIEHRLSLSSVIQLIVYPS